MKNMFTISVVAALLCMIFLCGCNSKKEEAIPTNSVDVIEEVEPAAEPTPTVIG